MIQIANKKIIISDSVISILERYKQLKKTDKEAGGIIIGQIKEDEIYVMKISTPNLFDRSSRYRFECDKDAAQIIIDYEFYNSGGKSIYLGEWHTHPERIPTPSSVDKKMIERQYKKNILNEPFLLLLIQGAEKTYLAMCDGKKLIVE